MIAFLYQRSAISIPSLASARRCSCGPRRCALEGAIARTIEARSIPDDFFSLLQTRITTPGWAAPVSWTERSRRRGMHHHDEALSLHVLPTSRTSGRAIERVWLSSLGQSCGRPVRSGSPRATQCSGGPSARRSSAPRSCSGSSSCTNADTKRCFAPAAERSRPGRWRARCR